MYLSRLRPAVSEHSKAEEGSYYRGGFFYQDSFETELCWQSVKTRQLEKLRRAVDRLEGDMVLIINTTLKRLPDADCDEYDQLYSDLQNLCFHWFAIETLMIRDLSNEN